nr:hypothetical protein [Enterovibrio nigricans]
MKIKHLLLPLLAAITLTACSDEPKDTPKYTTLETPVTVTNVPSINEIFSYPVAHAVRWKMRFLRLNKLLEKKSVNLTSPSMKAQHSLP